MAEFGIKATDMGAPNLSGAGFIASGVQDNSGAIRTAGNAVLIKQLGDTAVDAYKGYQLADVEKEQEKVIQEYMDRRDPTKAVIGAVNAPEASIFRDPNATPEQLSPVQKKFADTLAKYDNARKQGIMDEKEFSDRTLSVLREAVNKNPGLYPELTQHASKVLELSGITGIVKSDTLIQKSQKEQADAYIKDLNTRLKEQDIYYDSTTPIHEKESLLRVAETDKRNFTLQQRASERRDLFSKEEALKWTESNGDSSVRGGLSTFGQTLYQLADAAQASPTEYPKIRAQAQLQGQMMKETFINSIPVEIRSQPAVIQKIDSFNKGIDSTLTMLDSLGSGEDWKKATANHLQISKDMQTQEVVNRYDLASIDLVGNMIRNDPSLTIMSSTARTAYRDTGLELVAGNFKAPVIDRQMPKNINDNSLSKYIDSSAKLGNESGNYDALNKVLDSFNGKTSTIVDPVQRHVFLSKNLESLSKVDLKGASTSTVSRVKTMVGNYLNDPRTGLPSMLSNIEKYGVTMDTLPDGRIMFTGNEAAAFNDKFGIGINNALAAYANAHNLSIKEASTKFYPEYFKQHMGK